MRTNRTYPTYVKRSISVPDWAKVPQAPRSFPPAMEFTIGGAKSIARHEWSLRFGRALPSEDALKDFVFKFHYRWKGDHANRYEVLARWAYEFVAEAEKDLARATAQERKDVAADGEERPDIELTELVDFEDWWDPEPDVPLEPQLSLQLGPGRPQPGKMRRFILLNPPRKRRRSPKRPKRQP